MLGNFLCESVNTSVVLHLLIGFYFTPTFIAEISIFNQYMELAPGCFEYQFISSLLTVGV